MRSYVPLLLVLSAFGLLLTACDGSSDPLPQGTQTVVGLLKPASLSTVRRGTHLLEIDGDDAYFVESSVVALRNYQGKKVTLRGKFEPNVKASYLPVLVVESIVDVEATSAEHILPELGLSLTAPIHWKPVKAGESVYFTLGEQGPVIFTLSRKPGDELPEGGEPIVVGAKRATKMTDAINNNDIISVQQTPSMVLTLSFTPDSESEPEKQRADFSEVLRSFSFSEKTPSVAPSGTGSTTGGGASQGDPCGGTAGVLCPAGMYCAITNFAENIGRCRKM